MYCGKELNMCHGSRYTISVIVAMILSDIADIEQGGKKVYSWWSA